jgi:hypothetical protein
MEVQAMSRFLKALTLAGLSSAYLMQIDCTTLPVPNHHGFSVFSSLWGTVRALLEGFSIPFLQ